MPNPNYAIPGLMGLETPKADDDATHIALPEPGLDISKLATTGTRSPSTVLHGDGAWREPDGGGGGGGDYATSAELTALENSLGTAAMLDVGAVADTVAAGDDGRFGTLNPGSYDDPLIIIDGGLL